MARCLTMLVVWRSFLHRIQVKEDFIGAGVVDGDCSCCLCDGELAEEVLIGGSSPSVSNA